MTPDHLPGCPVRSHISGRDRLICGTKDWPNSSATQVFGSTLRIQRLRPGHNARHGGQASSGNARFSAGHHLPAVDNEVRVAIGG